MTLSAIFLSGTLDYVPKNLAEVTFAPSETVKTVQVIIVNDNTTELQEMFSGRLTPVFPIVDIGQGEAVVVIVDDDSELCYVPNDVGSLPMGTHLVRMIIASNFFHFRNLPKHYTRIHKFGSGMNIIAAN